MNFTSCCQESVYFVSNVAKGVEMEILLVLIHALGSHEVAVEVLPNELMNQNSGDLIVEPLLGQVVDVQKVRMHLNQKSQSFFIDIAVKKSFDHVLVHVEPLDGVGFWATPLLHEFFDNALRFSFLLDKRNNESDHIGNDVSVLNLLHATLLLCVGALRVIIFVFLRNNILSYPFRFLL